MSIQPPRPQQFTARLEEKITHSPLYTEFHFELSQPPLLENLAGQYVMIDVPNPDDPAKPLKRAYSMCDRPDITHGFEIVVATSTPTTQPGPGVSYLTSLQFGDQITLTAPLGHFVLDPQPTAKNFVFVATGSGIAPIKAMLAELLQLRQASQPIKLYWGMYHEEDYFWLDTLMDWQRAFPNFTFVPVVEKPSASWALSRGRVTDSLTVDGVRPDTEVYICGNPHMVTDVRRLLADEFQLPSTQIHFEQY